MIQQIKSNRIEYERKEIKSNKDTNQKQSLNRWKNAENKNEKMEEEEEQVDT